MEGGPPKVNKNPELIFKELENKISREEKDKQWLSLSNEKRGEIVKETAEKLNFALKQINNMNDVQRKMFFPSIKKLQEAIEGKI